MENLNRLNLDLSRSGISMEDIKALEPEVSKAHTELQSGTGKGNDFIGWLGQPLEISDEELTEISRLSDEIRRVSTALVVIGIGGSYLGSKAVISALNGVNRSKTGTKVIFAGYSLSERDLANLIEDLDKEEVFINIISKSGKTIEPAVTFRILRKYMIDRYGEDAARQRIIATTDPESGILREMSLKEGYPILEIPQNIGGRYSVFTGGGLLPIAVSGIDIRRLVNGAIDAQIEYANPLVEENVAYQYAAARTILYRSGLKAELLANFDPNLHFISEWWKQLYGESEGKEGKGLFTASVDYTTDLHSLGQYVQDGTKLLFETFLYFNSIEGQRKVFVESDSQNLDKLNYITGINITQINDCAFKGTRQAHTDGDVKNLTISTEVLNEETLGKLLYMFMKACAISGYMLDVNPFDQPGVEAYKNNMMSLLNDLVSK